jgi:hypothetical protein
MYKSYVCTTVWREPKSFEREYSNIFMDEDVHSTAGGRRLDWE